MRSPEILANVVVRGPDGTAYGCQLRFYEEVEDVEVTNRETLGDTYPALLGVGTLVGAFVPPLPPPGVVVAGTDALPAEGPGFKALLRIHPGHRFRSNGDYTLDPDKVIH